MRAPPFVEMRAPEEPRDARPRETRRRVAATVGLLLAFGAGAAISAAVERNAPARAACAWVREEDPLAPGAARVGASRSVPDLGAGEPAVEAPRVAPALLRAAGVVLRVVLSAAATRTGLLVVRPG